MSAGQLLALALKAGALEGEAFGLDEEGEEEVSHTVDFCGEEEAGAAVPCEVEVGEALDGEEEAEAGPGGEGAEGGAVGEVAAVAGFLRYLLSNIVAEEGRLQMSAMSIHSIITLQDTATIHCRWHA